MKKANTIVMWIAGLTLIIATGLKIQQMLTEPIISKGFWESWEFLLIQIPLELGLGIWLICGLFRKAGWLLGLIGFAGFIGVTLYKALMGAESCGCFGVIHVNPWITLSAIDIPIFLLLAIFRPKGEKLLPPPWPNAVHFFAIAIPTFIMLGAIEYVLVTNKQEKPAAQEWVIKTKAEAEAKTVVWPLLKDIDISEELRGGLWVVLMYHYDCPDCAKAIPDYLEMHKSMKGNDDVLSFAFIEMPPYGNEKQQLVSLDSDVTRGRLSDKKKWFLETPVVVVLSDGNVLNAWEGKAPNLDEILNSAFEAEN
ncbi:MAG: hypothetical protein PHP01_03430 [Phycisphaerae bacterium]|nr:hypothetical protein [Phycisphaerae bacterium]